MYVQGGPYFLPDEPEYSDKAILTSDDSQMDDDIPKTDLRFFNIYKKASTLFNNKTCRRRAKKLPSVSQTGKEYGTPCSITLLVTFNDDN